MYTFLTLIASLKLCLKVQKKITFNLSFKQN